MSYPIGTRVRATIEGEVSEYQESDGGGVYLLKHDSVRTNTPLATWVRGEDVTKAPPRAQDAEPGDHWDNSDSGVNEAVKVGEDSWVLVTSRSRAVATCMRDWQINHYGYQPKTEGKA